MIITIIMVISPVNNYYYFWVVVSTPLKNMKVSWDDKFPN